MSVGHPAWLRTFLSWSVDESMAGFMYAGNARVSGEHTLDIVYQGRLCRCAPLRLSLVSCVATETMYRRRRHQPTVYVGTCVCVRAHDLIVCSSSCLFQYSTWT